MLKFYIYKIGIMLFEKEIFFKFFLPLCQIQEKKSNT